MASGVRMIGMFHRRRHPWHRRHPRACPEDLLPVVEFPLPWAKERQMLLAGSMADPRDKPEDDGAGVGLADNHMR